MTVYLDIGLLGFYYCDADLRSVPKRKRLTGFLMSLNTSAFCWQRKVITVEITLLIDGGNLKPLLSPYSENDLSKLICGCFIFFFLRMKRVTVTFVIAQ